MGCLESAPTSQEDKVVQKELAEAKKSK